MFKLSLWFYPFANNCGLYYFSFMMKYFKHLLFLCVTLNCISQELPPLKSFYPQTYGGGDQNWSITQDANKIIYVANNKGLLSFNGSKWHLNPTPNQSIMRSVKASGDRIFSGQYRDFGFWSRDDFGGLEYTSLMEKFGLSPLEDEEFWGIEIIDDWLMFQSLDRIYVLNEKSGRVNIIESETTLTEMILVDDTIVFQKIDQGIYKIENGAPKLLTNDLKIRSEVLVDAFQKNSVLYFLTQSQGLFKYNGVDLLPLTSRFNEEIQGKSIYSGASLSNNYYALGSISNGLILFDDDGNPFYRFNQSNGLSNNTVLAVFEDYDGNIWLAMDNGISVINLRSQFKVYYDESGVLGTVYASIIYNDSLYLGTNQGLFVKDKQGGFTIVEGTEGQVWSLDEVNKKLFIGHDRGTFILQDETRAKRISTVQGTWNVKKVDGNDNLLIQGNYNGLYILEAFNGSYRLRNKLEGFNTSARYFEFLKTNEIVLSHEYKGIYFLEIDSSFQRITRTKQGKLPESVNSSLVQFNDAVYYGSEDGIYKYDASNQEFVKDSIVSQLMAYSPYVSGKLVLTGDNNKLWYLSQLGLSFIKPNNLSGDFNITSLAFPLSVRATKSGYENVLQLTPNRYLLGTTEGYVVVDLSQRDPVRPQLKLDKISSKALGQEAVDVDFKRQVIFENENNSIDFTFYAPYFDVFATPEFRYKLDGYVNQWSNWNAESSAVFDNLPHGDYTFDVQVKVGDEISNDSVSYAFTIERPWYLTMQALFAYLLGVLILGLGTHSVYRGYYKRQRNRLIMVKEKEIELKEMEAEQQIMRFRNDNLKLDIENKNRELGLSTMNLIQKNELLSDIKNQLSGISSMKDVKDVVKLINRKLNTTADWKVFEEAFNNADKDFLKNVKSKHPGLTSNDLRLCAYLRLNLSSKEIAPLLNISHKSVEVKRYRLRKKMNLSHETNLTDYILQI